MGQCKKILSDGKQCSNRAVPGTDFCETHKRIKFRRISRDESVESVIQKQTQKKRAQWIAVPSPAGDMPAFPGLFADNRNILVAPRGLVLLSESDSETRIGTLFDRLVRLLGCLSQEMRIPELVTVQKLIQGGFLVTIIPPNPDDANLSRHYDMAASAAEISSGILYVGDNHTFIRYRDGSAPRGYDAADVKAPDDNSLFLIDIDGTHTISQEQITDVPLCDIVIQIVPHPVRGALLPEAAYVAADASMYAMLARYFCAHELRYRLARFTSGRKNQVLFEIFPRPEAPAGSPVPRFILSYLKSLPHCALLIESEHIENRKMLVEWGKKYPCRQIPEAFPEDSLLLFMSNPDFPNMCITPALAFFDGNDIITVHTPYIGCDDIKPVKDEGSLPIEIPVKLMPDPGKTPFPSALILDNREISWLQKLVRRMPENLFYQYEICMGENYSVLIGRKAPIEGIPFGIPLRCMKDTRLYIPLCSRLVPDLPWELLCRVMEIKEEEYSFLAEKVRLDVSEKAFLPLSKSLFAEPSRPRTNLKIKPVSELPQLIWTLPNRKKSSGQSVETDKSVKTESPAQFIQNTDDLLRLRAEQCRKEKDFLSAGICYSLFNDNGNAANCFKEAGIHTPRSIET